MDNDFPFIDNEIQTDSSVLYNIEPIAIGTMYCESLTSYLARLSEAHCIKVGILLNKIIAHVLNKNYVLQSSIYGGNRFYDGAKALNGVDKNSLDLLNALEVLTLRKDLINLTLKKWKQVFTNRGLLKESLSWCPLCLKEFDEQYGQKYFPLLWYIKPVKHCLLHNLILLDECDSCKKKIPILYRSSINGLCPFCKYDLSLSIPQIIQEKISEKEKFIIISLSELIALSENLDYKLNRGDLSKKLKNICEYYQIYFERSLMKDLGLPKTTFCYWLSGNSIPTLDNLLNICFSIGISLKDFLFKEDIKPTLVQKPNSHISIPQKKSRLDHTRIERLLKGFLTNNEPLSMEAVAKEIGVPKRTLYRNFPSLCKLISKRYSDEIRRNSDERKAQIQDLINRCVYELESLGILPTQKNVEKHLSKNALLREKCAKEYLKKRTSKFKIDEYPS